MKAREYVEMILEEQDVLSVRAKLDAKKRGLVHQSHNVWKDKSGQEWKWNSQLKKFDKDTTRRAWNNKLDKIDDFLKYAYDSMSASDKKLKDSVFRAYYRYYNDGDIISLPKKTLEKLGMDPKYFNVLDQPKFAKRHNKKYEESLEKAVETVMKHLLQRYKNKISHKEVNFSNLKGIKDNIESYDWKNYYWLKKFGETVKNDELIQLANKLETINKGVMYDKDTKPLDKKDEDRAKEIVNSIFEKRKIVKECEEMLENVYINENVILDD